MADNVAKTTKPRKPAGTSPGAQNARKAGNAGADTGTGTALTSRSNRAEAKSRFNAALDEARAGAAALGAEAKERVDTYRSQATTKGGDLAGEAKTKAARLARDGKSQAARLARDGKSKASEALTSLSRVVEENVPTIDENLGAKYGDYARGASRKLQETARTLDQKSVEELGEEAREFVRKSPAAAVGLAALAGYFLARLLRR